MAGDWIKMRADLQTHPKVFRISSALGADRLRTIGALHAVWCLFDAHSVDGQMEGYSFEIIDSQIAWQGFAKAMSDVGWIIEKPESLELPEFDTHNGQPAKRRAMESDRKRKDREALKSSASTADNKRTRVEKSREENIKEDISTGADIINPFPRLKSLNGIDFSQWPNLPDDKTMASWLKCRAKRKLANTQEAMDLTLREVIKASEFGASAHDCIWMAAARGWGGFKADWIKKDIASDNPSDQGGLLKDKIGKIMDRSWAE